MATAARRNELGAMTTTTLPRQLSGTVLVVSDGTDRSHTLIDTLLADDRPIAVLGRRAHEVAPYLNAALRDRVWTVIADPADPDQVTEVIEKATDRLGPVCLIADPSGLIVDVDGADQKVA